MVAGSDPILSYKVEEYVGRKVNFDMGGEVLLQNDGGDSFIAYWDTEALGKAKPTEEQLDALAVEAQAAQTLFLALRKRKREYPKINEFLEAYTEKEIGGNSTKWDAYVIKYNKVKTDNPK